MERHHVTAAELADVAAPRSRLFQGGFGRLFPELDPWMPPGVDEADLDDHLKDFVDRRMVEVRRNGKVVPPSKIAENAAMTDGLETDFSSNIPAGYTYFGQFVDHDITFDPTSTLARQFDPNKLHNFRTPRLDLDCVYGRGPAAQPYMFQKDTPPGAKQFLIGEARNSPHPDLPRNEEMVALIGDMRNDENVMVSQLQLAFLLAHNRLVRRATKLGRPKPYDAAQRTLRWLYQWIVWKDFVRRVTKEEIFKKGLKKNTSGATTTFTAGFKDVYHWKDQPFMPVEFSGAAYRFGHSMVRNGYQTNFRRGVGEFVPIFANAPGPAADRPDLRGFRRMLGANVIEWDWFLPMTSSVGQFPQKARKIDTKLANALSFLHEKPAGHVENTLAYRNLKRSITLGLPAGSEVATTLGFTPIALGPKEPDALWYYVLKEAEEQTGGNRLGDVGSTIVCAVFEGLLRGDPRSWVNQKPEWTPNTDDLLRQNDKRDPGGWTLASIIRLAGLPTRAGDF